MVWVLVWVLPPPLPPPLVLSCDEDWSVVVPRLRMGALASIGTATLVWLPETPAWVSTAVCPMLPSADCAPVWELPPPVPAPPPLVVLSCAEDWSAVVPGLRLGAVASIGTATLVWLPETPAWVSAAVCPALASAVCPLDCVAPAPPVPPPPGELWALVWVPPCPALLSGLAMGALTATGTETFVWLPERLAWVPASV